MKALRLKNKKLAISNMELQKELKTVISGVGVLQADITKKDKKIQALQNRSPVLQAPVYKPVPVDQRIIEDVLEHAINQLTKEVANEMRRFINPSLHFDSTTLRDITTAIQLGYTDGAYVDIRDNITMKLCKDMGEDSFVATVTIPELRFSNYISKQDVRQQRLDRMKFVRHPVVSPLPKRLTPLNLPRVSVDTNSNEVLSEIISEAKYMEMKRVNN